MVQTGLLLVTNYFHACIVLLRLFEKIFEMKQTKIKSFLDLYLTLPLMMIAWLFFRCENSAEAIMMWSTKIFLFQTIHFLI